MKRKYLLLLLALLAVGCNRQDVVEFPPPAKQVIENNLSQIVSSLETAVLEATKDSTQRPLNRQTPTPLPEIREAGYITYSGVEGKTAIEVLKTSAVIKTKIYSGIGEFVESINGETPDNTHFWAFYVNGKKSTVGATAYVTRNTDNIEWKIESINN